MWKLVLLVTLSLLHQNVECQRHSNSFSDDQQQRQVEDLDFSRFQQQRKLPTKGGNEVDTQSSGQGTQPDDDTDHKPGLPYNFAYSVKDGDTDFSQKVDSDGEVVNGEYRVALPDGRVQVVLYTADWKNGFNPKISYDGVTQPPPTRPPPTQPPRCQPGYIRQPGSNQCVLPPCQQGYFRPPGGTQCIPQPCPPGFIRHPGSDECRQMPMPDEEEEDIQGAGSTPCDEPLIKLEDGSCACPPPLVQLRDGSCGCPPPQILQRDGSCGCPYPQILQRDGSCRCPPPQILLRDGSCGCQYPLILQRDGSCQCPAPQIQLPNGSCGCPPPQVLQRDGSCGCNYPLILQQDGSCQCPAPQIQLPNGSCGCPPPQILQADGSCGCPPGQNLENGQCVESYEENDSQSLLPTCNPGQKQGPNGNCIDETEEEVQPGGYLPKQPDCPPGYVRYPGPGISNCGKDYNTKYRRASTRSKRSPSQSLLPTDPPPTCVPEVKCPPNLYETPNQPAQVRLNRKFGYY